MSSDAQRDANRANSLLSTGAKTPEGKAKCSLNAVKTGLTGRTVLLPDDDAIAYQNHVQRFFDAFQPSGDAEHALTQSIADTEWRLLRIPSLEMGIYALGRLEFAERFENQPAEVRRSLIQTQTHLAYQKQLNNLSIQEARLRRQRDKDVAALNQLQRDRKQLQAARIKAASDLYEDACEAGQPFDPAEFGFEFSIAEIKQHLAEVWKQIRIRNHTVFPKKAA